MRIGIVGAENSHCVGVAKTLNIDRACGKARVVAVWGETRALAQAAAAQAAIPEIVARPEAMIGRVDGVMIDHRHAKYHAPAAQPFLEAGVPVFVDKPFSRTLAEGRRLLARAETLGVPVTSFSILTEQESFRKDLARQVRAAGRIALVESSGPCDPRSKWGGLFFYGVHQVEWVLEAFGPGIERVRVVRAGRGNSSAVAVLTYRGGGAVVSMALVAEGYPPFALRACGAKGRVEFQSRFDANPYLTGTRKFLRMFRTGKAPRTAAQILEPIAVLEAMQRSWKADGRTVRVAPV